MGSLHDIHLTPFSVSINLYMYNNRVPHQYTNHPSEFRTPKRFSRLGIN